MIANKECKVAEKDTCHIINPRLYFWGLLDICRSVQKCQNFLGMCKLNDYYISQLKLEAMELFRRVRLSLTIEPRVGQEFLCSLPVLGAPL
jgi:hypothetical protein